MDVKNGSEVQQVSSDFDGGWKDQFEVFKSPKNVGDFTSFAILRI